MTWREVTVIVWLGFSLGALTDTALRWRADVERSREDVGAAFRRPGTDTGVRSTDEGSDHESESSRPARGVGTAFRRPEGPTATTGVSEEDAVDILRHRDLEIPVEGVHRKDLHDTFAETRSGARPHEALDIVAERHTPVKAVEDGTIEKLFTSKAGGLTVYQFDPTHTFCYYYAHLNAYAAGLREGQHVRKDDVIGYVGSTGNASPNTPHLHFAIFRLTPEQKWWKGEPINPYPVFK